MIESTSTKPAPEGRRERKRRETRERIRQAAIALFLERGFDGTTIDDIAAAADVSKRSFFDYFPTKEDVVLDGQEAFADALAAAILARPAGEPLTAAVEEALTSTLLGALAEPQAPAIGRLMRETPALQARDNMKYLRLERKVADALARRGEANDADAFQTRLLAMVVVGAFRLAIQEAGPAPRIEEAETRIRSAFRDLWSALRALARAAP